MIDFKSFQENGYCIIKFKDLSNLTKIQELIKNEFSASPTEWHKQNVTVDDHVKKVKSLTDKLVESNLFVKLVADNIEPFKEIFGPDIEIQTVPHLRVSRPQQETDMVDWHRDTFYGNTPWEMNLWFPLFALEEGAGLKLIVGSHREPSRNVRDCQDPNQFRSEVTKGSVANQIGYVYRAKTDDTISNLQPTQEKLLKPAIGEAVLFFGCMAHRAQNLSPSTRLSLDLRLRNLYAPTDTRPGYYKPLSRGVVETCVQEFLNKSN